MASLLFDLNDAHDIIHENQDEEIVLSYIEHLSAQNILRETSSKSLHTLVSSIHTCLHATGNGKRIGLIALQTLVQDCSEDVFHEHGSNWVRMLWPFLQKGLYDEPFQRLLCSNLRIIVRRAAQHPDVSKQVTSILAGPNGMIESLLKLIEKFPCLANDAIQTIMVCFKTYPGSCGSTRGHVEKYLVANIDNPDGSSYLSSDILAKCFALMPRLGGGGSQGIQHKANFKDLFQKITYTLEDTIQDIVSLAPNNSTSNFGAGISTVASQHRAQEPFELPKIENNDLFKKSLALLKRCQSLTQCLVELINVPFPQAKFILPGLVMKMLKNHLFQTSLSDYSKSEGRGGNESKILLFIMPNVYCSVIKLLGAFLKTCGTSMILFAPMINEFILGQLSDFRNFVSEPMSEFKRELYDLLIQMCEVFGCTSCLEQSQNQKDFVSYVLSDLLPKNKKVVINALATSKKKRQSTSFFTSPSSLSKQDLLDRQIFPKACQALGAIIKAIGPLMSEVTHKQIQCVLIGTSIDISKTNTLIPKESKLALYETMISLLEFDHAKCPTSVQMISHLFSINMQKEQNGLVKRLCQHGLSLCMKQIHPSRLSMYLDLPLEIKTTEEIKKELLKVHVYYLESTNSSLQFSRNSELPNTTTKNREIEELKSPQDRISKEIGPDDQDSQNVDVIARKRIKEATDFLDEATKKSSCGVKKARVEQKIVNKENELQMSDDDDENDAIPSKEEAARIVKEVYSVENESIYIPDHVKNKIIREIDTTTTITSDKFEKLESSSETTKQQNDDILDAETMLRDFVPEFRQN